MNETVALGDVDVIEVAVAIAQSEREGEEREGEERAAF